MGCASWGVSTNIVTDHPVAYRHWLTDLAGDLVADGGALGVGAGTYHLADPSWHAPFVDDELRAQPEGSLLAVQGVAGSDTPTAEDRRSSCS